MAGRKKIKRTEVSLTRKIVCSKCGASDNRERTWETAKPEHRELARQLDKEMSFEQIANLLDKCRDESVKINQDELDVFGLSMDDFAEVLGLTYLLKKGENGACLEGNGSWDSGNILCPECVDADVVKVEACEDGFILRMRLPEKIRKLPNKSMYIIVLPWIAWKKDEV